jgi:hypothetical protein
MTDKFHFMPDKFHLTPEPTVPFVFILWGGAIWALILLKQDFSNVFAMVGGSVIFCTGIFFFLKRFLK